MTEDAAVDVRFDLAYAADREALLFMARAFHTEDGHPLGAFSEAAVLQVAASEALARAWIVRRATEAAGYLVLTLGYRVEYGGRGFIDDPYLKPELLGRGVGKRLLAFALEQAAE